MEARAKLCSKCGETDEAKFTPSGRYYCRSCHAEAMRKHRVTKQYGMSMQAYEAMRAAHDAKCAVCGAQEGVDTARRLHIDHSHATGAARGLLCLRCNQVLGRVDDNPDLLDRMAAYLRR